MPEFFRMKKNYRFAGLEISVCIPDEKIYENEYRLEPFSIERANEPEEFFFELREQLEEPSGICVAEKTNYRLYQDGNKRIDLHWLSAGVYAYGRNEWCRCS